MAISTRPTASGPSPNAWTSIAATGSTFSFRSARTTVAWRLIACLRRGLPTVRNVYDAAAWSSIVELTERAVTARGKAQDVPDFRRGAWQRTPALGIIES